MKFSLLHSLDVALGGTVQYYIKYIKYNNTVQQRWDATRGRQRKKTHTVLIGCAMDLI